MPKDAGTPVAAGQPAWDRPQIKRVGGLPLFDPLAGTVVVEPPGSGEGFWAGGPSAAFDDRDGRLWLSYRLRTQLRDHGRAGRGGETVVAVSRDGQRFERVWSAPKEAFDALSIEKSGLMLLPDGRFRLYVSYSSVHDYRWRIDMMEAEDPAAFDPGRRVTVLSPENTGTEGVKDPVLYVAGGLWHLYANMAPVPAEAAGWGLRDRMHREGNAFVSGEVACPTGLAISADGVNWRWEGEVIPCGTGGWDGYLARISALVHTPPVFTAIYDGRPNSGANYADRPSFAISFDMRRFHKVDQGRGWLSSPHGRGTVRYVEALRMGESVQYFYEIARADAAHELRTIRLPLTAA